MAIDPANQAAQDVYNKYINKTYQKITMMNGPAIEGNNPTAVKYLNAIFESAAGPDGILSKEEADAVQNFIENSGIDIAEISVKEAETLAVKWGASATALNGLSSITSSSDIGLGFERLFADADAAAKGRDITNIACLGIKTSVFFARIMKGKQPLPPGSIAMIRNKVNALMERDSLKNAYGIKVMLGMLCIELLRKTAVSKEEGDALVNEFKAKYFPGDRNIGKCDCEE